MHSSSHSNLSDRTGFERQESNTAPEDIPLNEVGELTGSSPPVPYSIEGQSLLEDSNIRGDGQYQDQGHRVEEYSRDMRRSWSIPASGWKFNRHCS